MKRLIVILLLLGMQGAAAQPAEKKSGKLRLSVITHDGKPESWLEFYIPNNQRRIPVVAEFDIGNVRAAIITDMHAVENKCDESQTRHIAYFAFDPSLNLKKFTTRINKPCIHNRTAKLKLGIATQSDERYYTIGVFTVHPHSQAGRK